MANTLLQDKAEDLRNRVTSIGRAMRMIDNSELDMAPEINHVVLSGASLPGFAEGTFCGQAKFNEHGEVLIIGVRHSGKKGDCLDLLVRREGRSTRVTERRYFERQSLTLTVTAVFDLSGDLLAYEEMP